MASKKATVSKLHNVEEPDPLEAPPVARVIRWIMPSGARFPAEQHAHFVSPTLAERTMCTAYHVEGGLYPPAKGMRRCAECVEAIRRLEDGGASVSTR